MLSTARSAHSCRSLLWRRTPMPRGCGKHRSVSHTNGHVAPKRGSIAARYPSLRTAAWGSYFRWGTPPPPSHLGRFFSSVTTLPDPEITSNVHLHDNKHADSETASTRRRELQRNRRLRERRKMLERRNARKQKRRQKQQQQIAAHDIPCRSPEEIHDFSDYLTKTYASKPLQEVLHKLSALVNETSKDKDETFTLPTVLISLLHGINPNRRAQMDVLEFLLKSESFDKLKLRTHLKDATSAHPDVNEEEVASAVETLLLARQKVVDDNLQWSQAGRRDKSLQSKQLASERVQWLAAKSTEQLRTEAQEFVTVLRCHMPHKQFQSTVRLFEAYVGGAEDDACDVAVEEEEDRDSDHDSLDGEETAATAGQSLRMRYLSSHLARRTGAHFYLIAEPAASFFGLTHVALENGLKYNRAKQKWEKQLLRNTKVVTELHQKLQDSLSQLEGLEDGEDEAESAARWEKHEGEEDLANQTEELLQQQLEMTQLTRADMRYRRPAHITYDVLQLRELEEEKSVIALPPVDRMVFLDNLPIDMTIDQVMELYSRCGDLESVTIYNQRPELDPGPLSPAKLRIRRKKQLRLVGVQSRRWQRPRSPVYAQLIFKDKAGYDACCINELRIFGMIVQKHPIRSLRASDMTSLFLEDIPDKVFCTDMEQSLNKMVRDGLFATASAGANRRARLGSCEIKFPSFELAYESYCKLLDSEMMRAWSDCAIHWMRTPQDAEAWWRRKRGFD